MLIAMFLVGLVLMGTLLFLVNSDSYEDLGGEQDVSIARPIELPFDANSFDGAVIPDLPPQNAPP